MVQTTVKDLDLEKIRIDFPTLSRETRSGVPLIYLDSAATSQKPVQVLDAMDEYYRNKNANIHRGIHTLAEEATLAYETAREKVASFVNAGDPAQLIFTRNTTESINLIALSWGRQNLKTGDRILLTEMEHHSNLVPWQILAGQLGLELDFVPVTEDGYLDQKEFDRLLAKKPKLVGVVHMSNVLGTINPVREMTKKAHDAGAVVVIDGAQSVPHIPVDLDQLQVDFFAFSAHKMCGPTGIGALYGKKELLEEMPPFLGGGEMIKSVHLREFKTNDLPHKFEAGTPAIAEAVGFGAAVDYLSKLGMEAVAEHEREMAEYAINKLETVPDITVFGPPAADKGAVASFYIEGIHAHDVAQILDYEGIAVRAGHHCAQPLHERYSIPATSRASFYLYNTPDEVDQLVAGINKVKEIFG
jgi:cysteine desulfurase/selenocysteine lyase